MNSTRIPLRHALPGMITACDILNSCGNVLINKGKLLTPKLIDHLIKNNVTYITIAYRSSMVPYELNNINLNEDINQVGYINNNNVRIFLERHHEATLNFEKHIKNVFHNKEDIDTKFLLSTTNSIIENEPDSYQLLKMLSLLSNLDSYTYSHSINVSIICKIIGKWTNLPKNENDILTLCGLLHDVGKSEIPNEIITKASQLTTHEYSIIRTHASKGYNLLRELPLDSRIKNAALMHHERNDGTGYPQQLCADKIDNYSKIVAIADVYDALTSLRPYKEALTPFSVYDQFKKEGLNKYDPYYFTIFFTRLLDSFITEKVQLSNGTIGNIVLIPKDNPSRPMIKSGSDYIDLSLHTDLSIIKIL